MAKLKNQTDIPDDKVDANPTKRFFVHMLTRDIDLSDAIMDLLDNCIDGVHRQRGKNSTGNDQFYKGFSADIVLSAKGFSIKDNCGGIPENVARHYAFKMGRDENYIADKKLETVGVYGIGMKRAIFKIGKEAEVVSHHNSSQFKVTIPKNWEQTTEWYFDFKTLPKDQIKQLLPQSGTFLKITGLHQPIMERFSDEAGFVQDLRGKLQSHYGYIIDQGFKLTLNTTPVKPIQLNLLFVDSTAGKKTIKPYVYSGKFGEVSVEMIIGFYRPPAKDDEIDDALDGSYAKSSSENAGITVLCNDRVVLHANKDQFTGWGENPVPAYHTQFINIAGAVHFRSNSPILLPVTTTKRGLDTSSHIYLATKNKMREGLKYFTAFTNKWKTASEERSKLFEGAKRVNALVPGQSKNTKIFNLKKGKKDSDDLYQMPDLPSPDDEKKEKLSNISYSREKTKIEKMRKHYFDGSPKSPSEIGGWCFDKIYEQID